MDEVTEQKVERLSLVNIKSGAAVEMFDLALDQVMENVIDVNTSLKAREIILKVSIQPTQDRSLAGMAIDVKTKLQGQEPAESTADIRIDSRGKPYGVSREQQRDLPFSNVSSITKKGATT